MRARNFYSRVSLAVMAAQGLIARAAQTQTQRPSLAVVVVLDRSVSMAGPELI
jgi:secreted protein with Ig-like and vWFA domain